MVDALASGASKVKLVEVQLLSSAPNLYERTSMGLDLQVFPPEAGRARLSPLVTPDREEIYVHLHQVLKVLRGSRSMVEQGSEIDVTAMTRMAAALGRSSLEVKYGPDWRDNHISIHGKPGT